MKYIVPLFVLLMIIVGFSYYTLFSVPDIESQVGLQSDQSREVIVSEPEPDPNARQAFDGSQSMFDLLERGGSLECSINYTPDLESAVMGNFFTNEGKFRGDFVLEAPGTDIQTVVSIIIAEDTIWQWIEVDGEAYGAKQEIDFSPEAKEKLVAPIGFDTDVEYNCLTWLAVDRTIFEPPQDVLFTDAVDAEFEEGVVYEEGMY